MIRLFNWSTFSGSNQAFCLSFEDNLQRTSYKRYFLSNVKIKDFNVMTDRQKNLFDQPVKNDLKTYDNIRKITTGQGDDYTTGSLFQKIPWNDSNRFK